MNQKFILEHKLVMPPLTPMALWGKTLSQMKRLVGVEIGREEGPLRDTPLPLCKLFGKVKYHGVNIV